MFNLTTPKAILLGFFLVAISIASLPYSAGMYVSDAQAAEYNLLGIELELTRIRSAINSISCN